MRQAVTLGAADGFTLIELLVAMVISLIVLGAGTYGLAAAFRQNTEVTGRTAATDQAEVGIERLALDLRQAVNGSCTSTDSKASANGVQVGSSGTTTTIAMCAPDGSVSSAPAGTVSVASYTSTSVPIIWTCNVSATAGALTPYTCTRDVNDKGSISVYGISGLTLTGLVNGSKTPTLLQSANTTNSYALTTTVSGSQAGYLSWVGIRAQVLNLASPENPSGGALQSTAAVTVQTGADLGNFGT